MNEELIFRLGLNSGAFQRGLKQAQGAARSAGAAIGSVLKSGIGLAFGAVTLGAMVSFSRKAMELGENIRTLSNELGVSTDFVQLWGLAAEKNNSTAEKAQKGLENLNTRLGEARMGNEAATAAFERTGIALTDLDGKAKSNEEVFSDLIQKIKDTEDPSIRSAIAAEFFGKKLHELTEAAIDFQNVKATGDTEILSERELQILHLANDGLEKLGRKLKLFGGKVLAEMMTPFVSGALLRGEGGQPDAPSAGISEADLKKAKDLATALKSVRDSWRALSLVGASSQTKLVHLLSQANTLQREYNEAQDGTVEKLKIQKQWIDKLKEAEELKHRMNKDKEEERKKHLEDVKKLQKEISDSEDKIFSKQDSSARKRHEEFMPTIQELAGSGFWRQARPLVTRGGFTPGPFARDAQSILALQESAKRDFAFGNTDAAKAKIDKANERYKRLADLGIVPQKVDEAMLEMEKHMKELLIQAKEKGIIVVPVLAQ